jgi:FixJ family two-component response regulator
MQDDVRMSGMNGWELHRQVSRVRRCLPIIFISALQDDCTFQRAREWARLPS